MSLADTLRRSTLRSLFAAATMYVLACGRADGVLKPAVLALPVVCPAGTVLDGDRCATVSDAGGPAETRSVAGESCVQQSAASRTGRCPAGMAPVPGGTLTSYTAGRRFESVDVQPFCMDITEVTVATYASCVRCGPCSPAWTTADWMSMADDVRAKESASCNSRYADRWDHPINCVDWEQSATYCRSQGKRLPTDEEWEWAARGESQGRTYPRGNAAPDSQVCWSGREKRESTCAVGMFPEGDALGGIHDLAGNVSEWTTGYGEAGARGGHAHRGGSWNNPSGTFLRADFREPLPITYRDGYVGFRCVQ